MKIKMNANCKRCREKIKGTIAYIDCKVYCASCYDLIRRIRKYGEQPPIPRMILKNE